MAIHWTEENSRQESLNTWTHGVGFLLSLPGGVALCMLADEYRESLWWSCWTYSLSLTALFLFSTLSHAIRDPSMRHRFRMFDQGLVYALIAGTFTPFAWAYMEGWARIALLSFVWIAAATGFYSKVIAKHRIDNMTTISYILLGWIPSMILFGYVSTVCFAMMAVGGVLYTVGTLFLKNDHRAWYNHAIWHIMVLVASGCHYAAIVLFTIMQIDR
jgi:hemolysin III